MSDTFDTFISFSSEDIDEARIIWNKINSSGLRAFLSDKELQKASGKSFVEEIHKTILNSSSFILLCSDNSISSSWVKEEYEAFYTKRYIASERQKRLFILPINNFDVKKLPPILQNLQVNNSIESIIDVLARDNKQTIHFIKQENKRLRSKIYIYKKYCILAALGFIGMAYFFIEQHIPSPADLACMVGISECKTAITMSNPKYEVNLPGNNYKTLYLPTPDRCSEECKKDENCMSWSMRVMPEKTNNECWLKNAKSEEEPNESTASGYKIIN